MNRHARHGLSQGCRADVKQSNRRRANENNVTLDQGLSYFIGRVLQQTSDRDITLRDLLAEIHSKLAAPCCRDLKFSDPDGKCGRGFLLRGPNQDRLCPLRDTESLQRQAREDIVPIAPHQGHLPDNPLIVLRRDADGAQAGGFILQGGMLPIAAAKPAMERAGSRPVKRKPGFASRTKTYFAGRMPKPRTILLSAKDLAKISVRCPVARHQARQRRRRPSPRAHPVRRPMLAGDIRSVCRKRYIKAIEGGAQSCNRFTTRARSVRGHGHCPMATPATLHQIPTIRTGCGS